MYIILDPLKKRRLYHVYSEDCEFTPEPINTTNFPRPKPSDDVRRMLVTVPDDFPSSPCYDFELEEFENFENFYLADNANVIIGQLGQNGKIKVLEVLRGKPRGVRKRKNLTNLKLSSRDFINLHLLSSETFEQSSISTEYRYPLFWLHKSRNLIVDSPF